MAAIFAGASRALLASVVFAFETTRQPMGLLPLLGGCTAAYLVSCLLMQHSIMTEKIARRGARVLDRVRGRLPRASARPRGRRRAGRRPSRADDTLRAGALVDLWQAQRGLRASGVSRWSTRATASWVS